MIRLIKKVTIIDIIIIEIRFDVIDVKREINYLHNLSRLAEAARSTLKIIYIFNLILKTIALTSLRYLNSYFLIRFKTSLRLNS